MLIVLEGIDGCGKDYVAERLPWCSMNFPARETPTGKSIDHQLKNGITDPMAFQCLQIMNRVEHLVSLKTCAGNPAEHLVLVRYWQSGFVYGHMDGIPQTWLFEMQKRVVPEADLNILLDVDPLEAACRRKQREGSSEFYETKPKQEMAAYFYRELWSMRMNKGWWPIVNTSAHGPDETVAKVNALITELIDNAPHTEKHR